MYNRNRDIIKKRTHTPVIIQPRFSAEIEYQLEPFNPTTIRDSSSLVVCGGRRTGKSYCMRDFVFNLRTRLYDCYVYSGTRDEDHPWEVYTPEKYLTMVQSVFPNDDLQAKLDNQKIRKQIAEAHGLTCPHSMIIFEDLEFLVKPMWKYQAIREVFLNGRWDKVFSIAAVQYLNKIELSIRSMMDYAVFMMENNSSVRERIWKQFCGILPTRQHFEAVFMRCTEDHKCLVVDCRSTSYKINEVLYWYKARDRGIYRIGVSDVWNDDIDRRNKQLSMQKSNSANVATVLHQHKERIQSATRHSKHSTPGSIDVKLNDR